MSHGQFFLFGLLALTAAAVWYDDRIEGERGKAPPQPDRVEVVARAR